MLTSFLNLSFSSASASTMSRSSRRSRDSSCCPLLLDTFLRTSPTPLPRLVVLALRLVDRSRAPCSAVTSSQLVGVLNLPNSLSSHTPSCSSLRVVLLDRLGSLTPSATGPGVLVSVPRIVSSSSPPSSRAPSPSCAPPRPPCSSGRLAFTPGNPACTCTPARPSPGNPCSVSPSRRNRP